jgi:hypothetical protein
MDENEIVSKIYCCGNSVQREAKILAAFDIVSLESEKKLQPDSCIFLIHFWN